MEGKFILGENIKRELIRNNISQKELAKKIGITEVSMSRYVSNDRIPNGPILYQIASNLNCSVEELLSDKTDINSIDVSDLTDEQIKVIKDLIKIFRKI